MGDRETQEEQDVEAPIPAGPAFFAEWDRHRAKILTMAVEICDGDVSLAEDLCHDTFERIASGRRPWREGTNLVNRCRGILKSLLSTELSGFHRQRFEPYRVADDGEGETLIGRADDDGPDEQVLKGDLLGKRWDAVHAALDGLAKKVWALTLEGILERQDQAARLGVDVTKVDNARERIGAVILRIVEQDEALEQGATA